MERAGLLLRDTAGLGLPSTICVFADTHLPYLLGDSPRDRCIKVGPIYIRLPRRLWERTYQEAFDRYQALLEVLRAVCASGGNVLSVCLGDIVFGYNTHDSERLFQRVKRDVEGIVGSNNLFGVPGNHDTHGPGSYRKYVEIIGGSGLITLGQKTVLLLLDANTLLPYRLVRYLMPHFDWDFWWSQRERNLALLEMTHDLRRAGRDQLVVFTHFGELALLYRELLTATHFIFGHSHFGFSLNFPGLPGLHEVGGMAPLLWPIVRSELLVLSIDKEENVAVERRGL